MKVLKKLPKSLAIVAAFLIALSCSQIDAGDWGCNCIIKVECRNDKIYASFCFYDAGAPYYFNWKATDVTEWEQAIELTVIPDDCTDDPEHNLNCKGYGCIVDWDCDVPFDWRVIDRLGNPMTPTVDCNIQ
jgi:hypothetical protein